MRVRRASSREAQTDELKSSPWWVPCLSAKHRKTKYYVNEQSKKASSCLSELPSTDSEEKFYLIDWPALY